MRSAATHTYLSHGASGMVATAHPLATRCALDVMRAGGNAVDAALAAAAVTWVVMPMMCGPGGDAFALVYDPHDQKVISVGSGGMAPSAASAEWFTEHGYESVPLIGPLAAGVPSAAAVMHDLALRFGQLEFRDHFATAIRYADTGFPVSRSLARHFTQSVHRLGGNPESSRIYASVHEGTWLTQTDLARTISAIAVEGSEVIYAGRLAEAIATYMRGAGGLMTADDLAADRVDVCLAPSVSYRGSQIFETAPPSQGFVVLEELQIAECFDLSTMSPTDDEAIHLLVEAKKLAVEDRLTYAGDPRFVEWDLNQILSDEHALARARLIDPQRVRRAATAPVASGDTTYLCAVDRDGLAISFVHSLSLPFGAAVTVPGTGILLNDRVGRGFTLSPNQPNQLAPRKRTISTLNCYVVTRDGRLSIVGGTPGGDGQVQWNLQVLSHMLDHGLDSVGAVSAPRWFHSPTTEPWIVGKPDTLTIEDRVPSATLRGLRGRGHRVETIPPWGAEGSAQVIAVDHATGLLHGASDPRTGGLALGY